MISYSYIDIDFTLKNKTKYSKWIKNIALEFGYNRITINYIFSNDNYILDLNKKFLNHNFYTDVITFDTSRYINTGISILSADIFISIDTVRKNSINYDVDFEDELRRVMVHGVLHLLGFDDQSNADKKLMTAKENFYISLYCND
jgi:probable rRNA maturation factor